MYDLAIFFSVVLSFVLYEGLGLLSGGMVSAGYLCLYLEQPLRILTTLGLSLLTYGFVLLVSRVTLLSGRRRYMLTILLSLVFSWALESALLGLALIPQDIRVIGHVVPGLIANDLYKQGIFRTVTALLCSAALVRLLLMAVMVL